MSSIDHLRPNRRQFVGAALGAIVAPACVRREGARPAVTHGVASGDVSGRTAVIWARADRPSQMVVEYSTTESFRDATRFVGPAALPDSDFTARALLEGLPPGQTIFYRVGFRDLSQPKVAGELVTGRFRTPSTGIESVRLAWSGDTAGQGWGIDVSKGGMLTYASILKTDPDFFIHSGDTIYADNPILPKVTLKDGTDWTNLTTPETAKVAETIGEFRGRHRYNLLDEHVRRFASQVPGLVQWDDHETTNNWYPGEILDSDDRYVVKEVDILSERAKRAFFEYTPTRHHPDDPGRIYRSAVYGPLVEVFLLDLRSYRGANSANRQATRGPASAILGPKQLDWLKKRLKASTAVWKVIASDMPIGLIVGDGPDLFEAVANGDPGVPLGRELEIADLLRFLKAERVRNTVWLTADVHYAAAHRYSPERAVFRDFDVFHEFVAGPLHAGNFGPGNLDPTFGPEVLFQSAGPGSPQNDPPSSGKQYFGLVAIDGKSRAMAVTLHDRTGREIHRTELEAEA